MEYCHKESPAPKKSKTEASDGIVKLTVLWNYEGDVLTDFLEKGATVNSKLCIEILKNLKKRIMRKGAETDDVLLLQDNARPLTNAATCDAVAHLGFVMLPHPANSPNLIPSNLHLFPKQKVNLRGQSFNSHEEVKAAARQCFQKEEKGLF
jgi:hypothetical protein